MLKIPRVVDTCGILDPCLSWCPLVALADVYVTLECISLVFLIYCNPMFIPGCTWVMSCPDVPIENFYNVNKSCQVIVGNPPIDQGLKSPQFWVLKYCNFEEYSICIFLWSPMVLLGEPLVLICTRMLLIGRTNKSHEVVPSNCKGGSLAPQCGYLSLHV